MNAEESAVLRPKSFKGYWPLYLSEHADPKLRAFHHRSIGGAIVIAAFVMGMSWGGSSLIELLLITAFTLVAVGYGLVFLSHWLAEGKVPTVNPAAQGDKGQVLKETLWSIAADYRMFWLALNERLDAELKAHNIQ